MKRYPEYIDRDGDRWIYDVNPNGEAGYKIAPDGTVYPFVNVIGDHSTTFEEAKAMYGLREIEPRGLLYWCLIVATQYADGPTWVEGPYGEQDARDRRAFLWDNGSYTIQMREYRGMHPLVDNRGNPA